MVRVATECATEILARIEADVQSDGGNGPVGFRQQALRFFNSATKQKIVRRHSGFGLEQSEQPGATDSQMTNQVGQGELVLKALPQKVPGALNIFPGLIHLRRAEQADGFDDGFARERSHDRPHQCVFWFLLAKIFFGQELVDSPPHVRAEGAHFEAGMAQTRSDELHLLSRDGSIFPSVRAARIKLNAA